MPRPLLAFVFLAGLLAGLRPGPGAAQPGAGRAKSVGERALTASGNSLKNRYALLIGIDYANNPALHLGSCVNDANRMYAFMLSPAFWSLPDDHISIITGEGGVYGTQQEVAAALQALLAKITRPRTATVYIYYSGHGAAQGIVPYDYRPGESGKLISYAWLKQQLDAKGVGAKILLLDTCHGGAAADKAGGQAAGSAKQFASAFQASLQEGSRERYTFFTAVTAQRTAAAGQYHSLYTEYLLQALKCRDPAIDRNNDCLITAGEVQAYLAQKLQLSQPPFYQGNDGFPLAARLNGNCPPPAPEPAPRPAPPAPAPRPVIVIDPTPAPRRVPASRYQPVFGSHKLVEVGDSPQGVIVGDINGDGRPDFVTRSMGSTVSVRLNAGSGSFSAGTDLHPDGQARTMALADMNGDGRPDLMLGLDGPHPALRMCPNDGHGSFALDGGWRVELAEAVYSLAAGDLNGDGHPDLALIDRVRKVRVLLTAGGSGPPAGPPEEIALGGPAAEAYALVLHDLDGDGDLDLLVAGSDKPRNLVSLLFNDGRGNFGPATQVPVAFTPYVLAAGNLGGKGQPGFVVAGFGPVRVSAYVRNEQGQFGVPASSDKGPFSSFYASYNWGNPDMALADLDGDGDLDLLLTASYPARAPEPGCPNQRDFGVDVRLNDGTGHFGDPTFALRDPHNVPFGLATADFDGDGTPDFITVLSGPGVNQASISLHTR